MNSRFISLLSSILPIYIVIAIGYFLRRFECLKVQADSSLMRLAVDVSLPMFIFYNMLGNEKLRSVSFSIITIMMGVGVMAIGFLVAWGVSNLLKMKVGEGKRTFIVATGSHNYGFFIIAFVSILFASKPDYCSELLGLVFTHNVGCDLFFWSLGVLIISGLKFSWKIFARTPIIAVIIALIVIWTGMDKYIPKFILNTMSLIGGIAIPLNLIIFGNVIYDFLGKTTVNWKFTFCAIILRMLFLPLVFVGLAVALPIDSILKQLLVLQAISPCGVMTAVIAKHFGGKPDMAVHIILGSSIISIVTAPIWFEFGFSLIK